MRKREHLSQIEMMVMLAILRIREDAYAVPIAREIEEQSEREVALASIYAALERLESKKLVASQQGEPTPERGGRARTYFKVTVAGVKELRLTLATLSRLSEGLRELRA
jgi:PadR family transcriptional regulator PadR